MANFLGPGWPIYVIGCDVQACPNLHRIGLLIVLSTVTTTPPSSAMRILTYVSTFAGFLLTSWLLVPCIAQIAVPLTTPLPLEVRSPYLNFWTRPSITSRNTTTSAELFAEAVRPLKSFFFAIHLRFSRLDASLLH